MDDPQWDKLRNSNDNLGNKPREKGITFLVVDYFLFFLFFVSVPRGSGERCPSSLSNSFRREIVTAFRAMNILRRWKRDRPTDRYFSYDASNFRTFFSGSFFGERGKGEKKRKKKKSRVMVNSFITFHTTHARLPVYPILLFCFRLVEIVQPILSPPVPLFFKYACFSRRDDPSFSATEKFRTIRSPSSLSLSLFRDVE